MQVNQKQEILIDKAFVQNSSLAIAFICIGVGSSVFSMIRGYSFNLLGEKVMLDLRSELFQKFLCKDVEFFDRNKSGELMSRISSDTTIIQGAASDSLSILFRNIIQFVGSFVILWVISYELTLILFLIVPPLLIVIALFIVRFKKYSKIYQDKLAIAHSSANEAFGNVRVVKSFAREKKEQNTFNKLIKEAFDFGKKKALLYGTFMGVVTLLGEGAILAVIWYGGFMVLDEKITPGQLSSFIIYTITLSAGLLSIGGILNQIITAVGISERLFELMDSPVLIISGTQNSTPIQGNITFQNVRFNYPTKPNVSVLKDVNLEIKQGQVVALVGSSGSGKSSAVGLLERFYDANYGSVKIDGVNIQEYDINWLREQIGFVSQEPTLFSGTLRENVTYGVNSCTEKDIENALEMANAKSFVYDLTLFPERLETIVGERGVKLSGGQKQRIAIARALIKNPKILIFDEATSALDAESEYQVQQAIDLLMTQGQKTIIVIAHRLSTIKNADNIVVLQAGGIKETGTHKELLQIKEGAYSKLIQRQIMESDNFISDL